MENDSSTGGMRLNFGEDDENMVSTSRSTPDHALDYSGVNSARDKLLRYRTRVFAAEYVASFCSLMFMSLCY